MREGTAAEVVFHPATKCCTFFPELPSFAIGALFLDEHEASLRGRELVRARIELGQQVTPLGIGRPAVYYKIYGRRDTFGVAETLRCPYYLDEGPGLCGVWRVREATCATWFCKHERGSVGMLFWRSLRTLLKRVEERLMITTALELGIDEGAVDALRATVATLDRDRDPEYYAGIWGPWAGRELEYYAACARAVSSLSWDEVRTRCGGALEPLEREAHTAWEELRRPPRLPELIRIRPFHRVGQQGETTVIETYSPFDSLALPDATVAGLVQHEVATAADLIQELGPLGVDQPLLERMLDAGLLEDGGP
jgi:hypothetical protein